MVNSLDNFEEEKPIDKSAFIEKRTIPFLFSAF